MSQSFIKKPDNGPHSALAGLGVLRSERAPANPLDVLRRIVAWRDNVHAGGVVRSADLEALIEEARELLPDGVTGAFLCRKPAIGPACETQCERCAADAAGVSSPDADTDPHHTPAERQQEGGT